MSRYIAPTNSLLDRGGKIDRAQSAASDSLFERLAAHELSILNRLISNFRGGTLTNEMMWGGIAAISELRSIANEARRDILQGTEAVNTLTGTANAEIQ